MDKNLKLIDFAIDKTNEKDNRLDVICRIYVDNRLTKRQRKACELFLFEPCKKNALRAIEITPKAWLFIKKFPAIHSEIVQTIDRVSISTRRKSYIKELLTYQNSFQDLLELLLNSSNSQELVRQLKINKMEKKLLKVKDEPN